MIAFAGQRLRLPFVLPAQLEKPLTYLGKFDIQVETGSFEAFTPDD